MMTLKQYLNSLGSTPDEIAATLEQKDIKGEIGFVDRCPIANAINEEHKKHYAWPDGAKVTLNYVYWDIHRESEIPLPLPIYQFICKFDRGDYPNLILK